MFLEKFLLYNNLGLGENLFDFLLRIVNFGLFGLQNNQKNKTINIVCCLFCKSTQKTEYHDTQSLFIMAEDEDQENE